MPTTAFDPSNDITVRRGETWQSRTMLADPDYKPVSVHQVFASDFSTNTFGRITTATPHCLEANQKIILEPRGCPELNACYTVLRVTSSHGLEVTEPLADGKGASGCAICAGGLLSLPRDLTGASVVGSVRPQYAGAAYMPTVLGRIEEGGCELVLADCGNHCPEISPCQMVDIPLAGIKNASVLSIERRAPGKASPGCYQSGSRVPQCVIMLSRRSTATVESAEMVLSSEVFAAFESEIDPDCGIIDLSLQTIDIPVPLCCPASFTASPCPPSPNLYGPYRYDVLLEMPDRTREFLMSGAFYIEPSVI